MSTRSQTIVTSAQLGAQLVSARKSQNLTQTQLASRLGISQRRVSELERAPGTLSVDQLMAFCAQLGLQLNLQRREAAPPAPATSSSW